MLNGWKTFQKKKPFLYGAGYHFASKLGAMEYRDYSTELYPIIKPHYAKRGIQGSVNTASFMYEYSNFGNIGMILSALLTALIFVFTEKVFYDNFISKISLNFFPIFLLSSGALTTALFSGGWGLVIVLYYIFAREFSLESEKK